MAAASCAARRFEPTQDVFHPRQFCIAGFGSFGSGATHTGADVIHHRWGRLVEQFVIFQDLINRLKRAGIRHRGARGDDLQRIAHHVRKDHGGQRGRVSQASQLPTLQPIQVLAHRVEFCNGGPATQEQGRHLLQVFQRDARRRVRYQGRSAARKQYQHQVFFAGLLQQIGNGLRPCHPGRIGNRVAGFHHPEDRRQGRAGGMKVLGNHHARCDLLAHYLGRRLGHLDRGLAGADDEDSFELRQVPGGFAQRQPRAHPLQVAPDGLLRVYRQQGCLAYRRQVLSQPVFYVVAHCHSFARAGI